MSTSELDANAVQQDTRDIDALIRAEAESLAKKESRVTHREVQSLYTLHRERWHGHVPFLPLSIREVSDSLSHWFDESVSTQELLELLQRTWQVSAREQIGALRTLHNRSVKPPPYSGRLPF